MAPDSSSSTPGHPYSPLIENSERQGNTFCSEEVTPAERDVGGEDLGAFNSTRKRLAIVVKSVLPWTFEFLEATLEVIKGVSGFVPLLPGLGQAAEVLLQIWHSLELVKANMEACLSIASRSATVLTCILQELSKVGIAVVEELEFPLWRLLDSFFEVQRFINNMGNFSLLKRYLERKAIQQALSGCHVTITDALSNFTTSKLIRILEKILTAERQHQADTTALLDAISGGRRNLRQIPESLSTSETASDDDPMPILVELQSLVTHQSDRDIVRLVVGFRKLIVTALNAPNYPEMIGILQVALHEMPEAIKALQRALEKEVEHDSERHWQEEEQAVLIGSANVPFVDVPQIVQSHPEGLNRSSTMHTTGSQTSGLIGGSLGTEQSCMPPRDTLDREFMETVIDALQCSINAEVTLPSWTITRYEVEWDENPITTGTFSNVFKGTWSHRVVAVKVLVQPTISQQVFVDKVSIWKTLQHPNVCELLGASSASSNAPWFFVSPYYKCGSLVTYLKGLPSLDSVDLLKMIHEIAKGMAYLHSKDVLHGDLKASNVLVNDKHHCIISDFDQSEMKSEAYRISGMPLPHGILRWQAPELMSGQSNLTQEIDVYAFAITVVELLTKGALPWPLADDDTVRHFVLRENMRPELPPLQRVWSQQLAKILHQCWDYNPVVRPPFANVEQEIEKLRALYFEDLNASESALQGCQSDGKITVAVPPRMELASTTRSLYQTALGSPMYYSDEYSRPSSPPPPNPHVRNKRDERRYRMLLQHEFHPSLTLPLWTPTPVATGAVGYHSKATYGKFVTLFNCFDPQETSNGRTGGMPSIHGYGKISQGNQRQDKRNAVQRSMDIVQSWLSSRNRAGEEAKYLRHYSSPLRRGQKTAHLITESTNYQYLEDLSTPKKWFKANVDHILDIYGAEHRISKEELYLVIGTLEAQDYALFVSHEHPDGQVDFNVFSAARAGHVWGEFSFSFDLSTSFLGGPKYEEESVGDPQYAHNVSKSRNPGDGWDSVLLARLRFKPDSIEPTSL